MRISVPEECFPKNDSPGTLNADLTTLPKSVVQFLVFVAEGPIKKSNCNFFPKKYFLQEIFRDT